MPVPHLPTALYRMQIALEEDGLTETALCLGNLELPTEGEGAWAAWAVPQNVAWWGPA